VLDLESITRGFTAFKTGCSRKTHGGLFYSVYPGDPYYEDFIIGQGVEGPVVAGPTALAEFFGDHIVVNRRSGPNKKSNRANITWFLVFVEFWAVEEGGQLGNSLKKQSSKIP
jgi:hypothetical protein